MRDREFLALCDHARLCCNRTKWKFQSKKKTAFVVKVKSEQEFLFAKALDEDEDVLIYYYELDKVTYDYRGKLRDYVVDFRVHLRGGAVWRIELKPVGHRPTKMDLVKWEEARGRWGKEFLVSQDDWPTVKGKLLLEAP